MTTKRRKAETIAECIVTICKFYGADPNKQVRPQQVRGTAGMQSRNVLVYHLYSCGMSFHAIGKILYRSVDAVRKFERSGAICMMGDDRAMIEKLPRIESTLEIARV